MNARELDQRPRLIVTGRNFEAISFVITEHPSEISVRERHIFWFFLACLRVRKGATTFKFMLGELGTALRRVGLEASESTIRRAIVRLEDRGYLSRRSYKAGYSGIILDVHEERWAFWLRSRVKNVTPTSVYISPRQSICEASDRSNTTPHVNTPNFPGNKKSSQSGESKKHRHRKILYSMFRLLLRTKAADRAQLLRRAEAEILAGEAGLEVTNHSGVPWEQFQRAFQEMTVPVREPFAAAEIVPRLRAAIALDAASNFTDTIFDAAGAGGGSFSGGTEDENHCAGTSKPKEPPLKTSSAGNRVAPAHETRAGGSKQNRYIPDLGAAARGLQELGAAVISKSIIPTPCKIRLDHKLKNVKSGITKTVAGADAGVDQVDGDPRAGVDLEEADLKILMDAKARALFRFPG